ncbi:MFS transporter [Salinispora arenicola]|uniref:Putative MFS family arabinose efflux permease n=1 Tax=Salinispora arenicola TaxID=168697 RepID=A0A542XQV7_SALAC|nr:MFS transporter [Salinispora arenicola]MCN0155161.1 MFS transporter [Salinispora arenicola]TQL38221.1 putative MFS family arabinose efflux permease [Salinispora arenicola]
MAVDSARGASAFWRWWTAGTASAVGSAVGAVALPLTALTALDASAFEMGIIVAASYVAWLVIGLPAGVMVQRLPMRQAQIGADLARAAAVISIPLTWWWGCLTVTQLVIVALVISFANVIFDVANATFLPSIVSKEQLQSRNSLISGTHAATQLGGPSVGGLIVQVLGAVPTLIVDAASYLVSALLLRTLPERRTEAPDRWPPVRAMIREGWRFVVHHPVMGPCMWAATAANAVCGAQHALYALYLVRELHAEPGLVGLLLAADGVGALIGAALTNRITARLGTARALIVAGFVAVAGALIVPLGTGWQAFVAFTVGNVVFSAGVVVLSVVTRTYRQIASPPQLLPRVVATVRFVSWGAIPVGGLVAGAIAGVLSGRVTLLIFVVAAACMPLILLASPIRHLRNLTDYQQGEDSTGSPPERMVGVRH